MRASSIVLLVLTVFAATPALAVPLSASDSVDIQVPSDIESRNLQIDSLATARAGDGDAALSEIFARNIPVLKSKREKTGPLPQSLSSRELGPHQRLNARFKYSLSNIKNAINFLRLVKGGSFFRRGDNGPQSLSSRELGPNQRLNALLSLSNIKRLLYYLRLAKKAGLFHREIAPEQLAARITPDKLFTEAREIGLQEDIQARSTFNVPLSRDDVADDFITSLLQSRDPEITPENIFALVSRVFDDLD